MNAPMDSASSRRGLLDLVRPELRGFGGYRSARTEDVRGDVWLNANEAAWANVADVDDAARRYPEPQPAALCDALAALYGCKGDQLLIGRGSDEAIDLLVRALCVPGRDAVVITPPVFGMYAVSARLQDARLVEVPLVDGENGLAADIVAIGDAALAQGAKLVFLCSPSNPGGAVVALDDVAALAYRVQGRALVVVDEAYIEFAHQASAITLLEALPNVAVLRTLSKAHALAAARIGVVIGDASLIAVLRACQAPYPVPAPCATLALAALTPDALAMTRERIGTIVAERARVSAALAVQPVVRRVYASQGNFVLARFDDASRVFAALLEAGVVVRDQRAAPQLGDALRITIGTPAENDRMLAAMRESTSAPTGSIADAALPPTDAASDKVSA